MQLLKETESGIEASMQDALFGRQFKISKVILTKGYLAIALIA
jgi:hypothetical protein